MPYIDSVFYEPAAAIAKGCCPECGRKLDISSYEVETRLHWPRGFYPTEASAEAIDRGRMLKDHFDALTKPAPAPAEVK